MKIKFREVTWYSKLLAVVVFVFLVPGLAFYIGMQYQAVFFSPVTNPSQGFVEVPAWWKTYTHAGDGAKWYTMAYPSGAQIKEYQHFTIDPSFELPKFYFSETQVAYASVDIYQSACHESPSVGQEVTINNNTYVRTDWTSDVNPINHDASKKYETLTFRSGCGFYIVMVVESPNGNVDINTKVKLEAVITHMLASLRFLN